MAVVVGHLVTIFFASVTLATYGGVCAHVWWRQCRCAGFLVPFHAAWTNICSRVGWFMGTAGKDSEVGLIAVEVAKLFMLRQLERKRFFLTWVAHLVAVYQVYWLPELLVDLRFESHYSAPFMWILIFLLVFQTLFLIFPKTLTPTSTDALSVVVMALYGARVAMDDDPYSLLAFLPLTAVARCLISLGITSVLNRILVNAAFGTLTCAKCLNAYGAHFGEVSKVMNDTSLLIMREVGVTFGVLLVCFAVDANSWAAAKATVTAKVSRRSEVMANLLLTALCDAVVHLNDSLHICKPAPQLAALLLMRSQNADLIGNDFLGFIERTDRQQLAGLSATCNGAATSNIDAPDACDVHPARLMNVHLLDSRGTRVNVQLLLATCVNLDDSINHIVGIREVGCEEGLPYRFGPASERPVQPEPEYYTGSSASSESWNTDRISDSTWESRPLAGAADDDNLEITMTVDASATGCEILECDPLPQGFGVSSLVGAKLIDLLGNRQADRLVGAIQLLGNEVMNMRNEEAEDSRPLRNKEFGVLSLRPLGRRVGIKYRGSCTITVALTAVDSMDAYDDCSIVEILTFKKLHRVETQRPGCCEDIPSGLRNCRGSPPHISSEVLTPPAGVSSRSPGPPSMVPTADKHGSPSQAVTSL